MELNNKKLNIVLKGYFVFCFMLILFYKCKYTIKKSTKIKIVIFIYLSKKVSVMLTLIIIMKHL